MRIAGDWGPGARLHRHGLTPPVGEPAILAALAAQAPFSASEHRFAAASDAGDLGYTWGSWEKGFYVRVWSRDEAAVWKLVLDVLQ